MSKVNLTGECVRNDDGGCTLSIRPVAGADCGCANLSITVNCDENCCSGGSCC